MKPAVDDVLDECLTSLQSEQATLEECLARYPDQAVYLRQLLETAITVQRVPPPVSSPAAFEAGKRRMLQALADKKRHQQALLSLPDRLARGIATLFPGQRRETPAARKRASAFPLALAAAVVLVLFIAGGLLRQSWLGSVVTQTATLSDANGVVEISPPEPPAPTDVPQAPGQTKTPQPPDPTEPPQPPGPTSTPEPPGQTDTPQPPGQTKTPQPPGQTKTPKPTKTP